VPAAELVLCSYCDTVHRRADVAGRKTARCATCDSPLYRSNGDLGAMLAVTITALIGFVVANASPLLTLSSQGHQTRATLWRSITAAYDSQLPFVSTALLLTLIIGPAIELGLLLWVLVPLCLWARPVAFPTAMGILRILRPWRMVEVFFLGVIVAVVKLSGLATALPGWGMFGIAVMSIALASLAAFDQGAMWRRAEEVGP
jgi:paraquat-inducible protein A